MRLAGILGSLCRTELLNQPSEHQIPKPKAQKTITHQAPKTSLNVHLRTASHKDPVPENDNEVGSR